MPRSVAWTLLALGCLLLVACGDAAPIRGPRPHGKMPRKRDDMDRGVVDATGERATTATEMQQRIAYIEALRAGQNPTPPATPAPTAAAKKK